MQNKKNIQPRNKNNEAHGYWETYWTNDNLCYKCFYVNDIMFGFQQWQSYKKKLTELVYCAK
jgi:hypothetical protein